MDVLSELLNAVRLEGALFYNAEFSAPWSFRSPPSSEFAPYAGSGGRHVILYHLVTEGRAWVQLQNAPAVDLAAGDIVVFPHGDSHVMGNGRPVPPMDYGEELERIVAQGLKLARSGGGGEITRFVCGYLACDPQLGKLLLAGLPPLLRVRVGSDEAGRWLENLIRNFVAHAPGESPGADAVRSRLSEVLFIDTLRRYAATLPRETTGWLAGARDPEIGTALALLHRTPAHPWTLEDLAKAVGLSRSVIAQRFQQYLGEPPMAYLARWRIRLAAQKLTGSNQGIARIAADVGYGSEAAFNRAFKREFGVPPAQFRTRSKSAGAPARA
jgi:AraC-like DNA-binding protein